MVQWLRILVLAVALALGHTPAQAPPPAKDFVQESVKEPMTETVKEPVKEPVTLSPESVKLRVRDGSGEFPKECSPQDVLQLVAGFVEAFNQGNSARLEQYFGEGFQWYSAWTSPDDGTTIYDLDKLQPYFAERHRHAEKLTLQALEVNAGSWHRGIDIVFNVQRGADDLKQGPINGGGKGMVRCTNKTIAVWSWGSLNLIHFRPSGDLTDVGRPQSQG